MLNDYFILFSDVLSLWHCSNQNRTDYQKAHRARSTKMHLKEVPIKERGAKGVSGFARSLSMASPGLVLILCNRHLMNDYCYYFNVE